MRRKPLMIHWILIGLFFPIIAFSQGNFKSCIYNDNGRLKIDTTLKISEKQFDIWYMSESNILALLSNSIDYSKLAKESDIQGIAIISFDCDTLDLNNIRILKNIGGGLDENIINGIEKISKQIVYEFRLIQNIKKNDSIKYLGTYYIPFDFSLIDLNEEMKKRNAIPIIDSESPLIGRWIE